MARKLVIGLYVASLALAGCEHQTKGPVIAASTEQEGYAARYPETLAATREKFTLSEAKARELIAKFQGYPAELDKPDWNGVLHVVVLADQAGSSSTYVARMQENEGVRTFFSDEKDEIEKKTGGAANYAAKQKGCQVDAYSPTVHALEAAMDKQLEKRTRERNEAEAYIDENEEALGKPNKEKLQQQAEDIALASYLVRVAVVQAKLELSSLVGEAGDVHTTLKRTIKEQQAIAGDAKRSDTAKKSAQVRVDAATTADGRVDSEVEQSRQAVQALDDRIKKLQTEYDQALQALEQAVKKSAG